ncbi:hypothetical protein NZD89_00315 [Alicyclobacillus fastidiosus]|uniref:Uncharacterized protein n=1 Tax=Alicyclobacillus fastidiosus TaxID=392011 RepID=A0ABY6ZGI8_9BACL|nr:hypothetical protein [Alicyclobacillus fastidiosus]WAH42008.1 hypothetical protein NZD89_00315 [Alicyclobacillus fastidiosus]
MRLVFIDFYFFTILTVSLCTGMTLLQRVVSSFWIITFVLWSTNELRKGLSIGTLVRKSFYGQFPAIVLVFTAPITHHLHIDGWTDGILALWETPFEPLFELLPPFHMGNFSGMYLEDCTSPFLLPALIMLLGFIVRMWQNLGRNS